MCVQPPVSSRAGLFGAAHARDQFSRRCVIERSLPRFARIERNFRRIAANATRARPCHGAAIIPGLHRIAFRLSKTPAADTVARARVDSRKGGSAMLSGVYRGIVMDSTDPMVKGRVKVHVPAVAGMSVQWAPVCRSGDGMIRVGATVVVAFEGGSPDKPIVIGQIDA
jgi:hypothetical protein